MAIRKAVSIQTYEDRLIFCPLRLYIYLLFTFPQERNWLSGNKKCIVTRNFLKNHTKAIKISCLETNLSVVMKHFCFAAEHYGFVARRNLFKTFPFSECSLQKLLNTLLFTDFPSGKKKIHSRVTFPHLLSLLYKPTCSYLKFLRIS